MSPSADLSARLEVIEAGYEYLLAYAAQGRQDDAGSSVRQTLQDMHGALDDLGAIASAAVSATLQGEAVDLPAFLEAVARDARTARGAISLVLSRPAIGSLLVDNLNASIHVRALLTDLFLIEQTLKRSGQRSPA